MVEKTSTAFVTHVEVDTGTHDFEIEALVSLATEANRYNPIKTVGIEPRTNIP